VSPLRQFVCDAVAKEFLDRVKGKRSYESCLLSVPEFALELMEALHDYHRTRMDYIKDCPGRYTVDVEEAD